MMYPGTRVAAVKWVAAVILTIMLPPLVCAQQTQGEGIPENVASLAGEGVSVRTAGGGAFQGTLMGVEPDRIELLLADGEILQIARSQVTTFATVDASAGSRSFYEDSASNRLVVMPTAFPMDRGEFQIADQEIAAVTGSYGINRWLSVWGGISVPGALFSLRASAHLGDAAGISGGAFVGALWTDLDLGPLVLPYLLASFGEADNNLTVGSGFMMTFSDGFEIPGAVFAVGGKRTLTAATAIVTENWVVWAERSYYDTVTETTSRQWYAVPSVIAPSVVFRIASNRLSWDIGAVVPVIINGNGVDGFTLNTPVIPIPVLSLTYRIR